MAKAKAAKLDQSTAGTILTGRDGDDFVIRVVGAYAVEGIPTKAAEKGDSDTRLLAKSPGLAWGRGRTWGEHPAGRLLGFNLSLYLSKPIVAKAAKPKAQKDTPSASVGELTF